MITPVGIDNISKISAIFFAELKRNHIRIVSDELIHSWLMNRIINCKRSIRRRSKFQMTISVDTVKSWIWLYDKDCNVEFVLHADSNISYRSVAYDLLHA